MVRVIFAERATTRDRDEMMLFAHTIMIGRDRRCSLRFGCIIIIIIIVVVVVVVIIIVVVVVNIVIIIKIAIKVNVITVIITVIIIASKRQY
nr:hypothetical protein BaRGS_028256 [Batillaria attramentaria]